MKPCRLIAALSFEDRATCGADSVAESLGELVMLDYGSRATPGLPARKAREKSWTKAGRIADGNRSAVRRLEMNPYSMRDLEEAVLSGDPETHTVVDLSCLTRTHVVAAARACDELSRQGRDWSVLYTTPLSYGNIADASAGFGWRDTLVLPIGREPSATNEGVSLGLALLGQESERLQIALDEVEPAAGFAVHVVRRDRPDLYRRTLASNDLVLRHLRSLRMPGRRADAIRAIFPSLGWIERGVALEEMISELGEIVDSLTLAAQAADAPVFLYPFGPKLGAFIASLLLASRYPEASWCIYPIAVAHPLDYSEGCAAVERLPSEAFGRLGGVRS